MSKLKSFDNAKLKYRIAMKTTFFIKKKLEESIDI